MTRRATIEVLAPLLAVPDVAATAAWYRDQLGFELAFLLDEPGLSPFAVLFRGEAEVQLWEGDVASEPGAKGGLSITVDDVDALYDEWRRRGALPDGFPRSFAAIREHPPEDKAYGRRDFFLVDPNGYILNVGSPTEE